MDGRCQTVSRLRLTRNARWWRQEVFLQKHGSEGNEWVRVGIKEAKDQKGLLFRT